MSKKEQLEKESKLRSLEASVVSNFAVNNGSLFRAAESLAAINQNNLFKAVKNDGKMTYRTFKAYLDHFELDTRHRKLLEKLIVFHEFLIDNKFEDVVPVLPTCDKFWAYFMKIKPEFWRDAIKAFKRCKKELSVANIDAFFTKTPQAKVGYCAERKLPTPVQNIIANARKLDNNSLAELILRGTNEAGFDKLYEVVSEAKSNMDSSTIIEIKNDILDTENNFSITTIDDKPVAVRFARPENAKTSYFTYAGYMVGGWILGRVAEYIISLCM